MRLSLLAALATVVALALLPAASARPAADDVSIKLALGRSGPSGVVGQIRETTINQLFFYIFLDVRATSAKLQTITARIQLPDGLRWGADDPDPSEGCVGGNPAVCTVQLEDDGGVAATGWYWDVIAERNGVYEVTASVETADPDPDLSNNTTTFRFEVAAPTSGGGGGGGGGGGSTTAVSASAVTLAPAKPKAGQAVAASVRVRAGSSALKPTKVACTGLIGKVKVKGTPSAASGRATCTYRPPKAAKGKRLTGSVSFTARGQRFTKRFAVKLG